MLASYFYSNICQNLQRDYVLGYPKLTPNFSCVLELPELKFNFYAFKMGKEKNPEGDWSLWEGTEKREGASLTFEVPIISWEILET